MTPGDRGQPVARRGFTLVEIIAAIGLLAIVGVVIGTIFASVGDTVTQGRQVSNLNRFVARVERVMRRDFENMVREDGFLVIRNELAHDYAGDQPSPVAVPLTDTDTEPRRRRTDEIMFFSRGDFASRRSPLHPEMVARSNVARVYYGHGQRFPADAGLESRYARPRVDELNNNIDARLGSVGGASLGSPDNPNEYAADWGLLRHVTPLVPRPSGLQDLPDEVLGLRPTAPGALNDYNRVADSSRQIALGPAAQSIFRGFAAALPYEVSGYPGTGAIGSVLVDPAGFSIRPIDGLSNFSGNDETRALPRFPSGIVDVAVTDLDEIRTQVTRPFVQPALGATASPIIEVLPTEVGPYNGVQATGNLSDYLGLQRARRLFTRQGRELIGTALSDLSQYNARVYGVAPPAIASPVLVRSQVQQRWMLDALPSIAYDPAAQNETGFRVRYEQRPPRVYFDEGQAAPTQAERRRAAVEQADQEMLSASVFLPRCTEFIVEWSFGIIDRRAPETNPGYGQPIWHGLRRYWDNPDAGSQGQYDVGGQNAQSPDRLLADVFGDTPTGGQNQTPEYDGVDLVQPSLAPGGTPVQDLFAIAGPVGAWFMEDGNFPADPTPGAIDSEMVQLVRVDNRVRQTGNVEDLAVAEYTFGYGYRDFNEDEDGDTFIDGDEDDVDRPWPWPKLIRVTVRYVDPSDLENEQTFQFEFRVPEPGGRL